MSRNSTPSKKKDIVQDEECDTCQALGLFEKIKQIGAQVASSESIAKSKEQVENKTKSDTYWQWKPPADVKELGNSAWTVLHTLAAYYPVHPTQQKKEDVRQFLEKFSVVYPCNYCADDFQNILRETPPRLDDQKEFSQWMCEAHNQVNRNLGKPDFDCGEVDRRWRNLAKAAKQQEANTLPNKGE